MEYSEKQIKKILTKTMEQNDPSLLMKYINIKDYYMKRKNEEGIEMIKISCKKVDWYGRIWKGEIGKGIISPKNSYTSITLLKVNNHKDYDYDYLFENNIISMSEEASGILGYKLLLRKSDDTSEHFEIREGDDFIEKTTYTGFNSGVTTKILLDKPLYSEKNKEKRKNNLALSEQKIVEILKNQIEGVDPSLLMEYLNVEDYEVDYSGVEEIKIHSTLVDENGKRSKQGIVNPKNTYQSVYLEKIKDTPGYKLTLNNKKSGKTTYEIKEGNDFIEKTIHTKNTIKPSVKILLDKPLYSAKNKETSAVTKKVSYVEKTNDGDNLVLNEKNLLRYRSRSKSKPKELKKINLIKNGEVKLETVEKKLVK